MKRIAALALLALALSACGDRRNFRSDEAEIVAWWLEDVAHGIPRRPEELRLVVSSERMAHVASWAMGDDIRGERNPPRLLQFRRDRHALLANLMGQGTVVVTASGLLAPRPGLPLDEREIVEPVVDAENRARRELDGIVLALSDAQGSMASGYLEQSRKARIALDGKDGAKVWEEDVRRPASGVRRP